jgi:cell division inhibitor SepF
MALKDGWDKFKGYFGGNHEDDKYYEDDMYEEADDDQNDKAGPPAPPYRTPLRGSAAGAGGLQDGKTVKMMVMEPDNFDDSQKIADHLRARRPVILNFEKTEPEVAKRIVDFISGATYALDGSIQKVGKEIFLCVPSNVAVDRDDHSYTDFTETTLAWKERE